jgi:hypothetical protein
MPYRLSESRPFVGFLHLGKLGLVLFHHLWRHHPVTNANPLEPVLKVCVGVWLRLPSREAVSELLCPHGSIFPGHLCAQQ